MKTRLALASLLVTSSAFAANFGAAPAASAAPAPAAAASSAVALAASGPQAGTLFRIVKPDGATLIQQGNMNIPGAPMDVINVSDTDSFLMSGGKCAFNVKYDEVSAAAASATVNRLYSNDAAIAVNSNIALVPGVVKTIWTQPYLFPGLNNVRVVINADSPAPSTKWVRVNVAGTCGAKPVATTTPPPATTPPATGTTTTVKAPVTPPAPPPVITFQPGSTEWNNLNVAWGYSNYATTQLKNKRYARYAELVQLNAAVTAAINAKTITQTAYNSLMTTWNTFVTEPAFKAAMATVVAAAPGTK